MYSFVSPGEEAQDQEACKECTISKHSVFRECDCFEEHCFDEKPVRGEDFHSAQVFVDVSCGFWLSEAVRRSCWRLNGSRHVEQECLHSVRQHKIHSCFCSEVLLFVSARSCV